MSHPETQLSPGKGPDTEATPSPPPFVFFNFVPIPDPVLPALAIDPGATTSFVVDVNEPAAEIRVLYRPGEYVEKRHGLRIRAFVSDGARLSKAQTPFAKYTIRSANQSVGVFQTFVLAPGKYQILLRNLDRSHAILVEGHVTQF